MGVNRQSATPALGQGGNGVRAEAKRKKQSDRLFRYATLMPAVIALVIFTVYPMLNLLQMSVSTITFAHGGAVWQFTPLANLAKLRDDSVFLATLRNTLVFVVVSVAIEMTLGFALAVAVSALGRFKGLIRSVMILPILVPPVAIGSMWKLMYNYNFGIFNQMLAWFGLGPVGWLSDPNLALVSVIIVDIWHWTPFVFLILFAGVEGLPREVIEAARVDGANNWQIVRKIILPLMGPAIAVAFIFRSILAFKVFDQIFLLTSGGPGTATEVVSLLLYRVFFAQNDMGYGALLSLVVIAMIVAFLLGARRMVAGRA